MGRHIEYEKRTVEKMIRLYCQRNGGHRKAARGQGCERHDECRALCDECAQLLAYAHKRLDHCRFGDEKPNCRRCPIHCYKPDMRQRMCEVMRWAGPRMVLYHPIDAVLHLIR